MVKKKLRAGLSVKIRTRAIEDADSLLSVHYNSWKLLISHTKDLLASERAINRQRKWVKKSATKDLDISTRNLELESSADVAESGSDWKPGCDSDAGSDPEAGGDTSKPIQTRRRVSEAATGKKRRHHEIGETGRIKSEMDEEKAPKKAKKNKLV
jgi:hypothetical protein